MSTSKEHKESWEITTEQITQFSPTNSIFKFIHSWTEDGGVDF